MWKLRGQNSGEIKFVPQMQVGKQAELQFQFNSSKLEGNLVCTRDDNMYLRAEIVNQNIMLTVSDVKSKRILKSVACKPQPGTLFNDNKWHKVNLVKKSRGQVI